MENIVEFMDGCQSLEKEQLLLICSQMFFN